MTRLFVVIPTLGRAEVVAPVVAQLQRQTRPADGILVAAVSPADVAGLDALPVPPEIVYAPKGLCRQRNAALDAVGARADIVLFLDDDFVPADTYVAELIALFEARPDLVGVTGRVIRDGVNTCGIGFDEAVRLVAADVPPKPAAEYPREALYGCNMAIRLAAAAGILFDEALPLYGWLEDIDFTYRLGRRGQLIKSERLRGVHMGVKGGRTTGVRFGYSQLANPIYMLRKRSAPPRLAWRMMGRNIASNLIRTLWPEPWVDRAGRLRGNALAMRDLATGRLDPRRILELD